jgi:hypothetical protein
MSNLNYNGLNENSSDLERLDALFAVMMKSPQHGEYVDCLNFKIDHSKQSIFESKVLETDFVDDISRPSEQTRFKLKNKAILLLDKYGTYSRYIEYLKQQGESNQSENLQQKKLTDKIAALTLEALERDKENADLIKRLNESQLALAEEQKKDIPINAEDRKTNLVWLIAIAIAGAVGWLIAILKW